MFLFGLKIQYTKPNLHITLFFMTDKNKFGNNAETTASDLPVELIDKLKGQDPEKTPVLSQRPNTGNPPNQSGEYRLSNKKAAQESSDNTYNPKERQVIRRPEFTTSTYQAFADLERSREEARKYPLTPPPEDKVDTNYPREADTSRPPAKDSPRPGYVSPSSIDELEAEVTKQDTIPTPVPDKKPGLKIGNNRKVSGQYAAPNVYKDVGYTGTPRFTSPNVPKLSEEEQELSEEEAAKPDSIASTVAQKIKKFFNSND